jgi:thymidylate synthase (FAD)
MEHTKRFISNELENILEQEIKVLDKGFIRVVDYMGGDASIAQAARVSYGKGTKTINDDTNLIRYLLRHRHTTPFEMCEIKLHIKAPIFIARQWLRHRTANVNEYSARYSIMEQDYYVPQTEQINLQSVSNKQGRGASLSNAEANDIKNKIDEISKEAFACYNDLLEVGENHEGIAKEIARIVLPVNVYTQFYWKIDLHNLLHFLSLRADPHAQYEIREYATKILDVVKLWVPITHKAFVDYNTSSETFSGGELEVIKQLLSGKKIEEITHSMSKRELENFKKVLGL